MKLSTVSDLLDFEIGQQVLGVKAIITGVFERNEGTNDLGPWTLQDLEIRDSKSSKDKFKVKLSNLPEVPASARFSIIHLICTQNDKQKWTGLAIEEDKMRKAPKGSRILKATPTAEVTISEASLGAAPKSQAPANQPASNPQGAPAGNAPANPPAGTQPQNPPATTDAKKAEEKAKQVKEWTKAVSDARLKAAKLANGYWIAILAVHHLADKYKEKFGEAMDADLKRGMATTILLELKNCSLINGLPTKDAEEFFPVKKAATQPGK